MENKALFYFREKKHLNILYEFCYVLFFVRSVLSLSNDMQLFTDWTTDTQLTDTVSIVINDCQVLPLWSRWPPYLLIRQLTLYLTYSPCLSTTTIAFL